MNRLHHLTLLTVSLCLLISTTLSGQKPINNTGCGSARGSIIINEVGNMPESKFGADASEFIELVAISDRGTAPISLSGFIIDDNYSQIAGNGTTSGHVVLGDCFSSIMPGTIILLYDDQNPFPGIDPAKDGTPNADGVYQVPFSSSCLIKVAACPSFRFNSYDCSTDGASQMEID